MKFFSFSTLFASVCLLSVFAPLFAATVGGLEVGAKVDESSFAPGGAGVTLHVAPNGDDNYKGADLGGAAHPFGSVEAAVTRANALQRGLITAQTALKTGEFPLPLWMKLVRKGDSIRAFVRSDDVPEWAPVGGEVPLKMGASAVVGLFVNNESRKGDATASFDKIMLNGQPISPAWTKKNLTTALISAGGGSFSVEGETVKVAGRGYEQKGDHVVGENGVFVFQPLPGDGEFVARLNGVTWVQDAAKKGFFGVAGVMIAEQAAANSRLVRLCAMGNGSASATTPAKLQLSTRLNAPTPAQNVKIRIAPGTYRLGSTLNFAGADLEGRKKTLVIERRRSGGRAKFRVLDAQSSHRRT